MAASLQQPGRWDHWEDFTTLTDWEKLIQLLNIKALDSFPRSEPSNSQFTFNFQFNFTWKRQLFKVTLHLSLESEHFIGTLVGSFPFVTIETEHESHGMILHVCNNEARLVLSAWLLASKDTWLENVNCFCSFAQDGATNYVGYCRNFYSNTLTNYVSHSFQFKPENVKNFEMLVEWCREKQSMLGIEQEPFELELNESLLVEPFPDQTAIYLVDRFERIFAIGSYHRPLSSISIESCYEVTDKVDMVKSHVTSKRLKIGPIDWNEGQFIFCSALLELHKILTASEESARISDAYPSFPLSPQQNEDFLNLFTFLFNGKVGTFSSRLVDCVLFVMQKEYFLLSMFWKEFCMHLRTSYGSVSTHWIGEAEDDSLALKLVTFEKYCQLLMEERQEAEMKEGKKQLLERLNLWEPFTASSNVELISAKLQLRSDMQAFKAANPDADFCAFIRWHSPNDWNEIEGCLSARMSASTEWHSVWEECEPIPIYQQSFTEQLNEFVNIFETITIRELIEFCMPKALSSFEQELNGNSYFNECPIIHERLVLLHRIVENYSWTEYFIEPKGFSLDEILEHIMRIEWYTLVVEYLHPHFSITEIQELLLYSTCTLDNEFQPDECPIFDGKRGETQIGRVISPSLQVYAMISQNSFHILEGLSEPFPT